jgi:hypothetical protein
MDKEIRRTVGAGEVCGIHRIRDPGHGIGEIVLECLDTTALLSFADGQEVELSGVLFAENPVCIREGPNIFVRGKPPDIQQQLRS